jgi:hypothetical protein
MSNMPAKRHTFSRGLNRAYPEIEIFFKSSIGKSILNARSDEGLPVFQVCIRDEYINVYWNGCSVLRYMPSDKKKTFAIHQKYTSISVDKEKEGYIALEEKNEDLVFNDWSFQAGIIDQARNGNIEMLKKYITKKHGEAEKSMIGKYLVLEKPALIDLEIAFTRKRELGEKNQKDRQYVPDRVDMAVLEAKCDQIVLKMIEVKLATDRRLRAKDPKDPEIIKQMQRYREFIYNEKENILCSYKKVAKNCLDLGLTDLLNLRNPTDSRALFQAFADGGSIDPEPYLLIIVDKNDMRAKNGINHFDRLCQLFKEEDNDKFSKPELWKATP